MVYLDRYIASWVVLGIVIGIGLGIMVGGLIPIPWVTHYRTVTIANSTTITIPINTTKTVTYTTTTTVGGKIETVTMTTTYVETTTTTRVVNNTVTKIIVVPTTTTVNHTTTVTNVSTTYIPYPYTTTVTTTVIENASQPLPLNLTDLNSTITWLKASYSLSAYGLVNLTLPLGYCEATIWVFPNASVIWIGVWFMPWSLAQKLMSEPWMYVFPFQKTGVKEYLYMGSTINIFYPNFYTGSLITPGQSSVYFLNIPNYPMNGYTAAVIGWPIIGVPVVPYSLLNTGIYQYLQNGTYIMILANATPSLLNSPITQVALNPPGLCVVQVIRVKPGTPDSYINNMTFLGAQYWAWVRSIAQYGRPAPCYVPWAWTYGYNVYRINVTEPIGENWEYYCGTKGIWAPLKP